MRRPHALRFEVELLEWLRTLGELGTVVNAARWAWKQMRRRKLPRLSPPANISTEFVDMGPVRLSTEVTWHIQPKDGCNGTA